MRLGLAPESFVERIGAWLGMVPAPLVHGFYGMAGSRVLMTALECGLVDALDRHPGQTGEQLATALCLDAAAIEHLVACLRTLAVVQTRTTRGGAAVHALSRSGARWLSSASPTCIADFLRFNAHQWRWWGELTQALEPGAAPFDLHAWSPEDIRWAEYTKAMHQLARLAAPEVCAKVPVGRTGTTLLDLAGGHGAFAAELCRRHPRLSATVLDLPGNNRVARELWAQPRIEWTDGNVLHGTLPQADIVTCFQLLGHLQRDERRALLVRMRAAVRPGGTLALMDHFASSGRDDASAFVALNYFLVARTPRLTVEEAARELREAGWATPRITPILRLPGQSLLCSRA